MKCNLCGQSFDPADLRQVGEHQHCNLSLPAIKGKRAIRDARELYPYCSAEFAAGVHSYLRKDPYPQSPQSKTFIQGYYAAERDLKDDFVKIQ